MGNTVQEQFTLVVLETSDIHGNIVPIHYANNRPNDVGMAKIATLLKRERRMNEHIIMLDNGDLIQGTPLEYHHARIDNHPADPMVLTLNHLQYDAAVFGNHEFNYGQDVLQKAIQESKFPWLSANIVKSGTQEPYYGKPYLLKEFPNGIKVGVLGFTTQYIPNWENPHHIKGIEFLDAVETAKKWVPFLREQEQVDVVVVSYHGGFERDPETGEQTEQLTGENQAYQFCQEVPGIDVLLTGHQHRAIAGITINGVTIVQPSHQGRKLGKVTIVLNKQEGGWRIAEKRSELISVEGIAPDQAVLELTKAYEQATQVWLDQPIGKVNGDMMIEDPLEIQTKDNPLIEFLNKVQMEAANTSISNTALFDLEAPGFKRDVTMRDIVSNYIYPNTLRVIRITGQDIKDALEKSATYFAESQGGKIEVNPRFTTPKPQHYNYDMWEGIEYKMNISRPSGQRVVMLNYKGKPLDLAQEYDVVMNNYRAGGGGNYTMFQGKPAVREITTDMTELIANYFMQHQVVEATVNHNWEVIRDLERPLEGV